MLAGLARAHMLVGHLGEAVRVAREALDVAVAASMPLTEGHARDTLGFSLAMTGEVDEGAAELREAIRIAREHDSMYDLAEAYDNYADMLHSLGRSDEALAVAAEGREAVGGRRPVSTLWLDSKIAEIAFDVGDWERSETILPVLQHWTGAQSRLRILLRQAWLAVGRGDHATAAALLRDIEPLGADSSEPPILASLGAVSAELRRREGDIEGARAAVDEWLGRIERFTDDATGSSALSAAGVTVEADAAERARDLGDATAESAALRRVDDLLARVAAAAGPTRPVERAELDGARAEARRAARRADPAEYARAAAAWHDVGRPEPAAQMRWREAEAHIASGDREAAATAARAAHEAAVGIGADWLRGEIEALAARARLTLGARRVRAARGGRVRPDLTRAPGARAAGRRRHEPRDRGDAVHRREDGQRLRLADPLEAERTLPDRGGRGGAPPRAGGPRRVIRRLAGGTPVRRRVPSLS